MYKILFIITFLPSYLCVAQNTLCNAYDVYSFIIERSIKSSINTDSTFKNKDCILHVARTTNLKRLFFYKSPIPEVIPDSLFLKIFQNLNELNNDHSSIIKKTNLRINDEFILKNRIKCFNTKRFVNSNFWYKYFRKYPCSFGIFIFAQPAFSVNGNIAFVYYECILSALGGGGFFEILLKKDTTWSSIYSLTIWIA